MRREEIWGLCAGLVLVVGWLDLDFDVVVRGFEWMGLGFFVT